MGSGSHDCRIYNVEDIMKDPQFKFRNDIIDVDTPFDFGKIKMQAVVPKMLGTPGEVKWSGQKLGHFNKELYGDQLGYSDEELAQLKADGVI